MRIKYVFWGYSDYMKVVNNDILYNKDVLYFAPNDLSVRQKILYNILFFMTRYGWENMVPEFIYRYLYPLQTIHGYEQVYFIIYEQNVCSTHLPFLEYLKKKYPHSKLFYMFTNTLSSRVNEKQLRFVENNREKFDMIITFNEIDAVEHNFQFYNQVCSVLNVSIKEENESDIFFCGLDKGRRAIIEQLRNRLESCGIRCDFNIVDSKHKLPYEVIVSKIVQTKCILEILMDTSQSGSSLRAAEAIAYKKKLLTNNAFIKAKEYFNDKQFSYFSTLEDIDVDFIKEALDKSQCVDSMIVSPKRFLDFLKQNSI